MTRRRLAAAVAPAALVAMLALPQVPPPDRARTAENAGSSSTAYARVLARHVREGTIEGVSLRVVDYAGIREDPDYGRALEELARARPRSMERDDRMAFWINAYNLLAVRLVVDRYPIASIREVRSGGEDVWGMAAGTAGGRVVSLGWIEDMLRREFQDPRVHFALVAAAVSCPDLRHYSGTRLDEQLDESTRDFLSDERRGVRAGSGGLQVSQLLLSYHEDFEPGGVVAFLRAHAPADVAARLERMRLHDLRKLPYDWSLNDLARASVAMSP